MHTLIEEIACSASPDSIANQLQDEPGLVLLRSSFFESHQARYSFLAVRPFLRFRSFGSRGEIFSEEQAHVKFGNPWQVLAGLLCRFELSEDAHLPLPLGGCFGYWGYELKSFTEPKLPRRPANHLELPDCHVGFYDSLVAFDHRLGSVWVISTGLREDGSRSYARARRRRDWWLHRLGSLSSRAETCLPSASVTGQAGGRGQDPLITCSREPLPGLRG